MGKKESAEIEFKEHNAEVLKRKDFCATDHRKYNCYNTKCKQYNEEKKYNCNMRMSGGRICCDYYNGYIDDFILSFNPLKQ